MSARMIAVRRQLRFDHLEALDDKVADTLLLDVY